jgi:hypothetical protein
MSRKTDFRLPVPAIPHKGSKTESSIALQQEVKRNSWDHVAGEVNKNIFFQLLPTVDVF